MFINVNVFATDVRPISKSGCVKFLRRARRQSLRFSGEYARSVRNGPKANGHLATAAAARSARGMRLSVWTMRERRCQARGAHLAGRKPAAATGARTQLCLASPAAAFMAVVAPGPKPLKAKRG